jgi:regulator of sigma E protease
MLEFIANNIWPIFLILLFFGGSIFVHELGHFLAARRRGLVVERFSIGFGPRIFGWRRNGVDYRLSLLPLGGYVALPQLSEMAGIEGEAETDTRKLPPLTWSDKMIVSVMGAVFNVLFACVLAILLWMVGMPSSETAQTTRVGFVVPEFQLPDGSTVASPAAEANLQPGDTILSIDGRPVRQWVDIPQNLATGSGRDPQGRPMAQFSIVREGETLQIPVYPQVRGEDRLRQVGIAPYHTVIVASLIRNSPAHQAGVRQGDVMVEMDGEPVMSIAQVYAYKEAHTDRPIDFTFLRDGERYTVAMQPVMREVRAGQAVADIGIEASAQQIIIHPNPVEQVSNVVTMTFNVLGALLNPASDIGARHLSGPVGIARFLHTASVIDWRLTVWVALLININLAILNLLPLPVLDGGHMVFATVAKLRGRPIPPNLVATLQSVFVLLLFGFMIYVTFFDIQRAMRDSRNERSYIQPELVEEEERP